MTEKILQHYNNELIFEKIASKNFTWKMKFINGIVFTHLLISFSIGFAVLFNSWVWLLLSIIFSIDLFLFILFKLGLFAVVNRRKNIAVQAYLKKFFKKNESDLPRAILKFRKKEMKMLFKNQGWRLDFNFVLGELHQKLDSMHKKFILFTLSTITAVSGAFILLSKAFTNSDDFFAHLTTVINNGIEKIPEELVPTYVITTISYLFIHVMITVIPSMILKICYDYHFRGIKELIELLQILEIKRKSR
ncbi:hypothetical protein UMM65_15985 [Aureibaculum sp. 2210JD6-5]|uniref:hypothetical protein n=1 Tax=Aureibaculum sp. 2210JD6-5 TaxID=3103957 RepID=UPI002AADD935|nr:hypothetical protein [Aureibaculum sp. 2210JD6-5]MDY7396749.1 hypothetical protein [Aureibaculum sp. 2210JD6-5]